MTSWSKRMEVKIFTYQILRNRQVMKKTSFYKFI